MIPSTPPEHPSAASSVLHLPSLWASARHSLPAVLEGVIGPLVVFYLVLVTIGYRGAVLAAFAWACLAILRRLVRHERVPTTLLFGIAVLAIRTVIAFVTGSVFLYFAQPAAGTCAVGLTFLISAVVKRPLIERFAHDFCPLDPEIVGRSAVRRFFVRVSFLWSAVMLVNAATVLWLLLNTTVQAFVVERTAVSWSLTATGILVSVFWFVRVMRREGVAVRFGGRTFG